MQKSVLVLQLVKPFTAPLPIFSIEINCAKVSWTQMPRG